MNLKKNTRLFQQRVDWKNPSSRIRSVMDQANRTTAAVVSSTQMRKGSKQQRRSSAGIERDTSVSLPGLAVEWNVDADSSWVWNDNQKGAAMNDPKLLTRQLQKNNFLPDEDDYLTEGNKVLPVKVLTSAYKKFLAPDNSFSVQTISYKSGKGKGKDKAKAPEGKTKARWLPSEATGYDLLMLPHPDLVNREDGTYLLEGPSLAGIKVMVTKENWETLRFNTKSMNPEYFPSSYLSLVPTLVPTELAEKDSAKKGTASVPIFPRSTITGTVEDFRILLRASALSKQNKIPVETYRALSLDLSSEASDVTDKATAPKRISAFLRLCAAFIPCEHTAEYDEAVEDLNTDVDDDVGSAKLTLENFQDDLLPAIVNAQSEAVSVVLQVLYALQLGHVQFLMADYRSLIIEAYPNAYAKVKLPRLGKDGLPREIQDVGSTANKSDNTVDMSASGDDDGTISGIDLVDGEGNEANAFAPSTSQKESHPLQKGMTTPSKNVEAAGFGSNTSVRKSRAAL
jgi:hypothetical protein